MKDKFAVSMFGQKRLSREGGIEIVVKELCTRMARDGCRVTCYNRSGHHVSGAEYDNKIEYDGIRQKFVPTIEGKGLAAVSSSFFAALYSAFGKYDVVHIHAEGPAFFSWLPKMFGKRVVVTIHGIDWQREKWKSGFGSKFIRQGEKNAVKYADEIIVLSKGVQDYFRDNRFEKIRFLQTEELSNRVYEMMDKGKKIFPYEGIGKALDILHTIQKAVIFSEDDLLYAYDYGVVDKKMFPTIDDLRKAITAFQVDGECVSIQKDEINYPISPSVLQEINAEYNGRNLLDVVGNMIHQYPEQRRYREQRCIDIYGKLI